MSNTTFKFNLYYGVVILLTVVLIVVIALKCAIKSCDCNAKSDDDVAIVEPYQNMNKYLNHLKKHKDIGTPSGLLSALPEQDNCGPLGGKNLIVQNKVTFKPTRFKTGCTYINMQYPGAL